MSGKIYLVAFIAMSLSVIAFGFRSTGQGMSQQLTGTGMSFDSMDLSLNDLVKDSEIIVLGKVVDQNSNGTGGELQDGVPSNLTQVPLIRNTILIEKVIKGNYTDKKIDVVTEGDLTGHISMEGNAKMNKGETVVLFLYREKIYNGQFVVTGLEQGKYDVDSNGLVKGKFLKNGTSIKSFEALIDGIARKSKT